jgi:DNA polymerase-1
MSKTWIVIDSNNLAYRSFYAVGGLSYRGTPTGVYYSFLANVLQYQGRFSSNHCVFCFDSKKSKRKKVSYDYKRTRGQNRTPEEMERLWELFEQIKGLRRRYLKQIGFKNIFIQPGYEADDLIASICYNLPEGDKAVVITTDSDLLQLINGSVNVYDPKKKFLWNLKRFREQYGLRDPKEWAIMKAIAGCKSDGVKGIKGIGEKTAIQFLTLKLSLTSKKYLKIVSKEGIETRKRNVPLVKLPYEGTKIFKLKTDTNQSWSSVLQELGIKTLNPDPEYLGEPSKRRN